MQTKKRGFSLVEIMVGLIIISVAVAAFAPVMIKRTKKDSVALNTKMTDKCDAFGFGTDKDGNTECSLCYRTPPYGYIINNGEDAPEQTTYTAKCVVCTKSCLIGQELDVQVCKCQCPNEEDEYGNKMYTMVGDVCVCNNGKNEQYCRDQESKSFNLEICDCE